MILCIPGFHQKIEQDSGDILARRPHQLRRIEIEDVDYSILTLNRAANDPAIMGQQTMAKKRRHMEIGIYREMYILKPVFDSQNRELLFCLQLSKTDDKSGKALTEFNEFDHSKLDLVSTLFRQRVEGQIYRLDAAKMKGKVFDIMRSCKEILL